jgi:hypothetical protein
MTSLLPNRCGLYLPGHMVHWIQGLNSGKDRDHLPVPGRLISVGADGDVVVEVDGEDIPLWNHEPDRLRQLVEANHGAVSYQPTWGLLRTPSDGGNYCFCVAPVADPNRLGCPEAPPTGDPIQRLQSAGGFTLRADELLRWAEHQKSDGGNAEEPS